MQVINATLFAVLIPGLAWAKSSDRQHPATIEANASTCNTQGHDHFCHYAGHVEMEQGTLHIQADTADIFLKNGELNRILLLGKQTHLTQELDDGSPMQAVADKIEYLPHQDHLVLTGHYQITSPKGSNAGQYMVYNTRTGDMQSGGDGSRVHTVIQPKSASSTAPAQSPSVPTAPRQPRSPSSTSPTDAAPATEQTGDLSAPHAPLPPTTALPEPSGPHHPKTPTDHPVEDH